MNHQNFQNVSAVRTSRPETTRDIRLLVLDIDGTILDRANHIKDSVKQAIKSAQRQGVAVALATGRLFQTALHTYKSIGSTLPLICFEGALIREPDTGFVHRHWPIEPSAATQLLDLAEGPGSSGLSIHFHVQDSIYVVNLNDASTEYCERSKVEPVVVSDFKQLLNLAITKVTVLSNDAEAIARFSSQIKNSDIRTRVTQDNSITFLEAFHPAVNKGLAVSYLAENILGLRPENVMAVGDELTDLEMLKYAGVGVAMGNAPEDVKTAADWVTTTIEEDGVARAIERWILRLKGKDEG